MGLKQKEFSIWYSKGCCCSFGSIVCLCGFDVFSCVWHNLGTGIPVVLHIEPQLERSGSDRDCLIIVGCCICPAFVAFAKLLSRSMEQKRLEQHKEIYNCRNQNFFQILGYFSSKPTKHFWKHIFVFQSTLAILSVFIFITVFYCLIVFYYLIVLLSYCRYLLHSSLISLLIAFCLFFSPLISFLIAFCLLQLFLSQSLLITFLFIRSPLAFLFVAFNKVCTFQVVVKAI